MSRRDQASNSRKFESFPLARRKHDKIKLASFFPSAGWDREIEPA